MAICQHDTVPVESQDLIKESYFLKRNHRRPYTMFKITKIVSFNPY